MKYMLDTSICVFLIRNKPGHVLEKLHTNIENGIAISTIVLAELEFGVEASAFHDQATDALRRFLSFVSILRFDNAAAAEYGKIRAALQKRGTPIGPMDTLIAAHAISEKLTLVTNNVREFKRVEGLSIVNWAVP